MAYATTTTATDITRFPLSWPVGWPRTKRGERRRTTFKTHRQMPGLAADAPPRIETKPVTVAAAVARLLDELERLGAASAVISTNVPTKISGLPYSNAREPDDPGAAVYFKLKGTDLVLACDTWTTVAGNVAAIAQHIDALRRIDRYGVGRLEQAFAGYARLPAKGTTWKTTLGFAADQRVTKAMVEQAFRERARVAHPDAEGGSHDAMASLTQARAEAEAALRVGAE